MMKEQEQGRREVTLRFNQAVAMLMCGCPETGFILMRGGDGSGRAIHIETYAQWGEVAEEVLKLFEQGYKWVWYRKSLDGCKDKAQLIENLIYKRRGE